MANEKRRTAYLDLLRVLAMVGVVGIHVPSCLSPPLPVELQTSLLQGGWCSGPLGVPSILAGG